MNRQKELSCLESVIAEIIGVFGSIAIVLTILAIPFIRHHYGY